MTVVPQPSAFLSFLFLTIARKVPPLELRESAAVARYLENLGWEGRGPDREFLRTLSHVIWAAALQRAKFKAAEKGRVLQFLAKFADTIRIVKSLPQPKEAALLSTLRAPFMSPTLGPETPRLSDDLTERICAGYWMVRFARMPNAQETVAETLNRHKIPWSPRLDADAVWTGAQVRERIKQFERREFAQRQDLYRARRWLVDKWVMLYYPNPAWEQASPPRRSVRRRRDP